MSDEIEDVPAVRYVPRAGDRLECENGPMCCWQVWDGVSDLGECGERHALTVLSEVPDRVVEKPVLPNELEQAKALFASDPDVVAFLDTVAEFPGSWSEAWEARRNRAREVAWARDEMGLRTRALHRSSAMVTFYCSSPKRSVDR